MRTFGAGNLRDQYTMDHATALASLARANGVYWADAWDCYKAGRSSRFTRPGLYP